MSRVSNPVKYLGGIFDSFGVPLNHTMRREIIYELEHEGIILWRSKYGWLRIITGYNDNGFTFVEAPLGYATSSLQTFLHINHLGFQSETVKEYEDFEFYGVELIHINRFWKWFLITLKKLPSYSPQGNNEGGKDD